MRQGLEQATYYMIKKKCWWFKKY